MQRVPAFAYLGSGSGEFPIAESIAVRTLSLPLWVGTPQEVQERMVEALRVVVSALS